MAFTRISHDAAVMGGNPCIRDLGITVGMVVGLIASGYGSGFWSIFVFLPPSQLL